MAPIALRRLAATAALLLGTSACVFTKESPYVVNAGDSTPVAQRENGSPFDRITDRTPIVAFEYGRCAVDSDCAPRGCDNAVCAPEGVAGTCVVDDISACLSQVRASSCGCTDEGVCRWTRDVEVMQCARRMNGVSESRAYSGAEGESYPWRPYY